MGMLSDAVIVERFDAYELDVDLSDYQVVGERDVPSARRYMVTHRPCGKSFSKRMTDLSRFNCGYCSGKRGTLDERLAEIADRGFIVVDGEEYENTKTLIRLICPAGHLFVSNHDRIVTRKHGCAHCVGRYPDPDDRLGFIETSTIYELTENSEYVNKRTPIEVRCPDGHVTEKRWQHLRDGTRCKDCLWDPEYGDNVENIVAGWDLVPLEPYTTSKVAWLLRCFCGTEFTTKWHDFRKQVSKSCGCGVSSGFDKSAPAVLYLIRVNDLDVKVGITNLHPDMHPRDGARVPKLERSLPGELVAFWRFDLGAGALKSEKQVKKHYKGHRVKDEADGDGYTERIKGVHFKEVWATVDTISICNSGK